MHLRSIRLLIFGINVVCENLGKLNVISLTKNFLSNECLRQLSVFGDELL